MKNRKEENYRQSMIDAELKLLCKVLKNNDIFRSSKITVDMIQDSFVRIVWIHMGGYLGNSYSEFIPRIHLAGLVKDDTKMGLLDAMSYKYNDDIVKFDTIDDVMNYVYSFDDDEVTSHTLEMTLLDDFTRRNVIKIAEDMINKSNNTSTNMTDYVRATQLAIDKIAMAEERDLELRTYDEMIDYEIINQNIEEEEEYTPTGIQLIDDVAGGVRAPATIYPLAASKIGKSTILYDITNKLLEHGKKILFVTIEIGIKEAQQKLFSNKFGIDYKKIAKKNWDSPQEKSDFLVGLEELKGKYKDQLFIMYDKNGVSPKNIEARYTLLKKSGIEIDDIMVDYLGLLNSDSEATMKSESEKFRSLPKEIRILSQKTNTRIFVPHQLHNTVKKRSIEEIYEDDIYFCKTIGHEATAIIVMHIQSLAEGKGSFDKRLMMKWLPSRIEWSDDIYVFPDNNPSKLHMGEGVNIEMCPQKADDIGGYTKPSGTPVYADNSIYSTTPKDVKPMF